MWQTTCIVSTIKANVTTKLIKKKRIIDIKKCHISNLLIKKINLKKILKNSNFRKKNNACYKKAYHRYRMARFREISFKEQNVHCS